MDSAPLSRREEEIHIQREINRGGGERQRKGLDLESGNSNNLLGTKGLEKLQKSML